MKNGKQNVIIKNATDNHAELFIYSDIVSDEYEGYWVDSDAYPEAVKNFLDSVKGKDLTVFINSNGGSVTSGLAIYNMLIRHIENGHKVKTVIDGVGASIASVIAFAGIKSEGLYVPENAFLMVHRAWVQTFGNAGDLREMADTLDKIDESILSIYQTGLREGVSIETIKELVANETWLSGKDALAYFNIQTTSKIEAVACATEIQHKTMPFALLEKEPEGVQSEDKEKVPQIDNKQVTDTNEQEQLMVLLALL